MNKTVLTGATVAALLSVAGCRRSTETSGTSEAGREAAEQSAQEARAHTSDVSGLHIQSGGLSGSDDQGRPLWSIGARQMRVLHAGGSNTEDDPNPRRAILTGAWAKLFREGRLESQFSAPRLDYAQSAQGDLITLSGGVLTPNGTPVPGSANAPVMAHSAGALRPDIGPMVLMAPRIEINTHTRHILAPRGARARLALRHLDVTARRVESDLSLATMRVTGEVRAQTPQGAVRADSGTWNWKTGRATASGHIVASNPDATLTGSRLNANIDASRGELTGGVTAHTTDGGSAQAPRVQFDWQARTLHASGGVTMQKDGGTLRAADVTADSKLSVATASGGVVLQKDGGTLRANQIRAFDRFARATATGGVTLEKDGATMRAAQLDAFDKMSRAVASGGVTLTREGATLNAARIEAFDHFTSARASGNVQLARGDMRLSAGSATALNLRDEAHLRVEAADGVRATSGQGSIAARHAIWTGGRSGIIQATGEVTLSREGHRLSSPRGQAQLRDGQIASARMEGGVNGRLSNGATLSATTAVYTATSSGGATSGGHLSGRIVAEGEVRADYNGAALRAGRAEVTEGGNVLVLTGGITVTTRDGVTIRSPEARYDRRTDLLVASNGVVFDDAHRGLHQTARSLTVHDLSKPDKRRATLEGVQGSGPAQSLNRLRVF